ncbi:hypothetical protein RND81_11G157500 [Saponaria officinalis]|uniref:Uncharacterized protein n=1 Tax=Saponaria officinalis TaxID=3572 RepID=A0AAW1HP85_SAPOF
MEPKKHHIVCIPAPAQGHINLMFKLAKLLHSRGFYITFVHTEFNYVRLSNSSDSNSPALHNLDDFRFKIIPDGLPPENKRGVLDLLELCRSLSGPGPCRNAVKTLLVKLGKSCYVPPITCVISDAHTTFTYEVGEELGIKVMVLYTTSACGALGFLHYDELIERGFFPLKVVNGGVCKFGKGINCI